MSNALQKKLRLLPDQRIAFINFPPGILDLIGTLPDEISVETVPANNLDLLLLFAQNSAELAQYAPEALVSLKKDGLLWIAYPKRSSGLKTDLTRGYRLGICDRRRLPARGPNRHRRNLVSCTLAAARE